MSDRSAVQRLGRVEYIEPNNIFPGNITNGIPQPYENYAFSVNLRVINGNRYDCGMPSNGEGIANNVLEFSSDRGTLSFTDGTSPNGGPGYLTTNFTDISMNDPNTNTRECLGINRISVKYDSYYYPTVDIDFVDVRGASLMQPAEYEYYNNGGPNIGKNLSTSNSKFFKAFFSFPYPLFKLSVKGFYGKEVTYDLSVLKANIVFNSDNGNFELHASFIGYMYGMYGDLPFPFVYLAPYIDPYGKKTWDEKCNNGDFTYFTTSKETLTGRKMYTFPELKEAVDSACQQAEKEAEKTDDGIERAEIEGLLQILDNEALPHYPATSKNFTWWSWSKTNTVQNRSGYFFLSLENNVENNRKIFEDFYRFSSDLHKYNELAAKATKYKGQSLTQKGIFENIYVAAEESKKTEKSQKNADETSISSDFSDDTINKILSGRIVNLTFHKDDKNKEKPVLVFDGIDSGEESDYADLIQELKERFDNSEVSSPMKASAAQGKWNIKAYILNNINYKDELLTVISNMKSRKSELTSNLNKFRDQEIDKAIKFKPTIKNLYSMIFAHIDTFMTVFYNTLARIRASIESERDKTRRFDTLCGGGIQVDVNDNTLKSPSSNGGKLPPFTMFYREETKKDSKDREVKMIWPGSLIGGENLDEVKLVEAIINATSLNKRSFESVTPKDNIILRDGNLAPTNYYDIIRNDGNPYLDILNDKTLSDEKITRMVVEVFMLRCFYSLLNGSHISPELGETNDGSSTSTANFTKKAKLIANLEIGNVERAFQMLEMNPSKNFLVELLKISNDGSVFMSDYLKKSVFYADTGTTAKPVFTANGTTGDLSYSWIKKSSVYCYPVGTFNPTSLQNYLNGGDPKNPNGNLREDTDKFLKIDTAGTIVNGNYAAHLYTGGRYLEKVLEKYTSGDFASAARLFPNYKSVPSDISGVTFCKDFVSGNLSSYSMKFIHSYNGNGVIKNLLPAIPSGRKTSAGITSIFMDPLYYAQSSPEARAYLFLLGIPFGKDKKFYLPETVGNGDYPTLMLLREGAIYWRSNFLITRTVDGAPIKDVTNDVINYKYYIGDVLYDALPDIEKNDPCLGVDYLVNYCDTRPKNASVGRKQLLIDYFLRWATGVPAGTVRSNAITAATYTHVDVPAPSLDFQTIERMLGLWYLDDEVVNNGNDYADDYFDDYDDDLGIGYVNKLLSYENCDFAVLEEDKSADSFANSETLKEVYNIGSNGELGKVMDSVIRTDVTLKSPKTDEERKGLSKFLQKFSDFYFGFDTLIDFSCLDAENVKCTVPRSAMNDAISEFVKGLKDKYKVSIEKVKELYGVDSSGQPDDSPQKYEQLKDNNVKLACYIALKGIYDKWLCSRPRDSWTYSSKPGGMNLGRKRRSDFSRFYYINEFYHNIGMVARPNLSNFVANMTSLGGFTGEEAEENLASSSIITALSKTAEGAGCALLTMPTELGLARGYDDTDNTNKIEDVFKAFPFNEAVTTVDGIETSFIVLYTSQKSSTLDNEDESGEMAYKSDGFDIANTWGEIIPQPMFADLSDDSFVVPAFGVTFAKQNQTYFKDIRLSMEDHQITDFSIKNTVRISYQNTRGPRETSIVGQDLYSVYSNYSYSCHVTMMGDAQITPLMYFQLNNIPMWKGAYLITNVHHDITPDGMTTEFYGTRQARPSLPFKDGEMLITAPDAAEETPQSQNTEGEGKPLPNPINISEYPLDKVNVDNVESVILVLDRIAYLTEDEYINNSFAYNQTNDNNIGEESGEEEDKRWISGILSARVYYKDRKPDEEPKIYTIAYTVESTHGLTGKIEDFTLPTNDVIFSIPKGRYSNVMLENASANEEYRDPNESFYNFTGKKHIMVSDFNLGFKRCEIITGEANYREFDNGGFKSICFGGASPIMLFDQDPHNANVFFGEDDIRAIYTELFNFVKRMNEAKKPLSMYVSDSPNLGGEE